MTKTVDALDRLAETALAELSAVRPSDDSIGAAVAAAALLAQRAASEASDRDRVIRIARHEGASLRVLAEATGLSRQTIANICTAGVQPRRPAAKTASVKRGRAS